MIEIQVAEEVLVERLAGRFMCRNCGATYHKIFNPTKVEGTCDRCGGHEFYQREDDKPETVKNRLSVNIKNSEPILAYYDEEGLLYPVDGDREIDAVFADVERLSKNNLPTDLRCSLSCQVRCFMIEFVSPTSSFFRS